jgi:hypothetical protein
MWLMDSTYKHFNALISKIVEYDKLLFDILSINA